ncbi:hypothetical protein CYMTET_5180 [Cymbomonas tetramitiformis]|uniref:Uncharacterized protein n=1 Tax=Cymbomonas tetramitiformis TaxID=36881 RepID=A0AAE0H1K9_9CHLO|nr:hypothetical protein CYMTET_5180 [Cymbomonas tetramitiformis]
MATFMKTAVRSFEPLHLMLAAGFVSATGAITMLSPKIFSPPAEVPAQFESVKQQKEEMQDHSCDCYELWACMQRNGDCEQLKQELSACLTKNSKGTHA